MRVRLACEALAGRWVLGLVVGGAQHSHSNIRLTLMRIGALRVPSDEGRRYGRAEGLAGGSSGAGVGPDGRRIGAPPPACGREAAARRPRYMSRCGERALRAVVTDSQWRRRPTVCPSTRPGRRRALHRPAALRLPPAGPLLTPPARHHRTRITRSAPKNFPHRVGKIDCAASPE